MIDDGLSLLELEVPERVHRSFVRPGQFQRVRHQGTEAMFAIGSSPGATRFEYLIRRGEGVSQALSEAAIGAAFELSTAEGPGFPLERAQGLDGAGVDPEAEEDLDRIDRDIHLQREAERCQRRVK